VLIGAVAGAVGAAPSVVAVRRVRDVTYPLTPALVFLNPDFAGDSFPTPTPQVQLRRQLQRRRLSGTGAISLDVRVTLGSLASAASLSSALAAASSTLAAKMASTLAAAGWAAPTTAAQITVAVQPFPYIAAAASGAPAEALPVPLVAGAAAAAVVAVVVGVLLVRRLRARAARGSESIKQGGRPGNAVRASAPSADPGARPFSGLQPQATLHLRRVQSVQVIKWGSLTLDTAQPARRGGMGVVYKAFWVRHDEDVAVKVLDASMLSAAEAEEAIAKEADLLQKASAGGANRFVLPLIGIVRGIPPEQAWGAAIGRFACGKNMGGEVYGLIMAWLPGGSLEDRLYGASPWDRSSKTTERLLLLERVADCVARLHSNTPNLIVHGDIKSDNILLTCRGAAAEPRLIDFGVATAMEGAPTKGQAPAMPPIQGASAGGTVNYMAPEMFRQRDAPAFPASPRTDVYALASLCWETLVGKRPWRGYGEADRLSDICRGKTLDFTKLPSDVPPALRTLLEKCTALDPAVRPSASELRDGLRAAREQLESKHFDVFLSHAWNRDKLPHNHAPETVFVRQVLRDNGDWKVWVDKEQLQNDWERSLKEGINASKVVVALVSRKYANSYPCRLEMSEAKRLNKKLVVCIVEPDNPRGQKWLMDVKADSKYEKEIAEAVDGKLFVALGAATAAAEWRMPLSIAQHKILYDEPAIPRLLNHVRQELQALSEEAQGGGAEVKASMQLPST
jgi:serine/threonine protein kinase